MDGRYISKDTWFDALCILVPATMTLLGKANWWAPAPLRHRVAGSRDRAVREAAAAGLSIARIQKITGLATTTIMRILNQPPKPWA